MADQMISRTLLNLGAHRFSGIRKATLRESHDTAWRFIRKFSWKLGMCCVTANCGPSGEPVACAYKDGHDGNHSWATLPTFGVEVAEALEDTARTLRPIE